MNNIQTELAKTNNIISKTVLHKMGQKLDQTLLHLGKIRQCCETCLVKIQKSQNGEWIKCNHQTKILPAKIKSSNCSKKYQGSYSTIKKKQHDDLLKYNLTLKKQSLLIQQSNAKSVRNQTEIKPIKLPQKVKTKTKTVFKKNNFSIIHNQQYGCIQRETLPISQLPIVTSQSAVSKQNLFKKQEKIVQKQYQPIQLLNSIKNQNSQNSQNKQNDNHPIKIQNHQIINKQEQIEQQSLLDDQNIDQQNHNNTIVSKHNKSSFYHQTEEYTKLKQSTKTNQQTMTEGNKQEHLQSDKQHLIDFNQFKQCCDRFYSLLNKGKANKPIYQYQQKYQLYIKSMEDKFLKSRQNLLQIESSVQQLERKADKYFMKNAYSNNSPYNSKRQSLEVDPFHLLLSSVNEGPQMEYYQITDHMNDYFHLLLTQANTIQQFLDGGKAQKSLEQLIN